MLSLKKNLTFIIFISILAVFFLASLFYLAMTVKENSALNVSKNKKLNIINGYFRGDSFPPSQVLLEYYRDKDKRISEYYKSFYSNLISSSNKMPAQVLEPLKLKEKLVELQSQIIKKAKKSNLSIGEGALYLGFDKYQTEIPLAEDIPDVMVEAEAIKELLIDMMRSGVLHLEYVKISDPQDKKISGEEKPFVRIFPVQLSMEAAFEDFVEFLNFCGNSDFIFVFSDMHIYQSDSGKKSVKADILLNVVIFL